MAQVQEIPFLPEQHQNFRSRLSVAFPGTPVLESPAGHNAPVQADETSSALKDLALVIERLTRLAHILPNTPDSDLLQEDPDPDVGVRQLRSAVRKFQVFSLETLLSYVIPESPY